MKILQTIKKSKLLIEKEFEPQTGDCANFAVALQRVIGKGDIKCSPASQIDIIEPHF